MTTRSDNTSTRQMRAVKARSSAADPEQMLKFKRFFHDNGPASYLALPEADSCSLTVKVARGPLKNWSSKLASANRRGCGVFMAINRLDAGPIRNDRVKRINAVFIDVDGTMKLSAIQKLKPHMIVRTSSSKYHAYWRVKGLSVAQFKHVQKALAAKFGTDPAVCNPARLMRMPGTLHQKAKPTLAKILHIDESAKPQTVTKLARRLGLELEEEAPASTESVQSAHPTEVESALAAIPTADDRATWLKVGMALHSLMPDDQGCQLWTNWSKPSAKFKDEADQRKNWASFRVGGGITGATLFDLARRHGWKPVPGATTLPVDEFGLVDEFAARVKAHLRFESTAGKWMLFQSPVWVADEAKVVQASRQVIQPMIAQAKAEGIVQSMKVLGRYASTTGVRTLLKEASAHPELNVKIEDFDRHPNLFAAANGVVDLCTSGFRSALPEELLKCQAPTPFDAAADCPKFKQFVRFITCRRPLYAAYLQRALGYTLFGHTNEQVFFIVHGSNGGNGKGTLFRLMAHVLGPFVKPASPHLLSRAYSGNPNGSSPAIMALHGPRMIQVAEGEERHRFDTAFVKQLSGSDPLSARRNHGDQVEFTPEGKLWMSANHLPDVPKQDDAMWRRIRVLPFDAQIEARDGAVEDALKAEAPGVLNWLIAGAKAYQTERLGECSVVTQATMRARKSGDSVAAWIKNNCQPAEGARIQASVAFADYRKFCRSQDRQPLVVHGFAKAMNDKGFKTISTKSFNVFSGIRLVVS
jgi:putative DNA primase/helicase